MASDALDAFVEAVGEVRDLERADPTPPGEPPDNPEITRVVGRASVVLLSSHLERYIRAVNQEAAAVVNSVGPNGTRLPTMLRLLHSRTSVDSMLVTGWEHRESRLREFMLSDGWLWNDALSGPLTHDWLLTWMKAPTPKNLVRYYRYWGIDDIFNAITRASHTRDELWLRLDELVGKRNNIAHGDASTEATAADIDSYRLAARRFCERSDKQLARALKRILACPLPWY
jgi:RiboL-PSP-HEPN